MDEEFLLLATKCPQTGYIKAHGFVPAGAYQCLSELCCFIVWLLLNDTIISKSRQTLEAKKSKKALWHGTQSLPDWFVTDSGKDLFTIGLK